MKITIFLTNEFDEQSYTYSASAETCEINSTQLDAVYDAIMQAAPAVMMAAGFNAGQVAELWDRAPEQQIPFDVERMIETCVPGGDTCDPQAVADAIRTYCEAAR
jgi:hypothetical protein